MSPTLYRVVLDTNVLVRALINVESTSGRILQACERRVIIPLLSKPVLIEYRGILSLSQIVSRYPQLNAKRVKAALNRLSYVGDVSKRIKERFDFPRDPKDAKLIELAIAGRATHIISTDRDLLDLPNGRTDAGKAFRQRLRNVVILEPMDFVRRHIAEPHVN